VTEETEQRRADITDMLATAAVIGTESGIHTVRESENGRDGGADPGRGTGGAAGAGSVENVIEDTDEIGTGMKRETDIEVVRKAGEIEMTIEGATETEVVTAAVRKIKNKQRLMRRTL